MAVLNGISKESLIGQGKLICHLNTTETSLFAADVGNRGSSSENSQIITISDHEEYHIEHPNEQITSKTGDQNGTLWCSGKSVVTVEKVLISSKSGQLAGTSGHFLKVSTMKNLCTKFQVNGMVISGVRG